MLAVLDAEGLEQVKLVGHDWGGWVGFLLCLRAPERFERYEALNILTPWPNMRAMVPQLWRFWYQLVIAAPGLGYRAHRSGRFVPKALIGGSTVRAHFDDTTLRAFGDNLAEPARARACVQMYRVFNLHESPEILRGRYADARLTVPTRLLFGTDDPVLRPEALAGYQRHADDMQVELVPGCSHFIADEMPDLVAERALEFFSGR